MSFLIMSLVLITITQTMMNSPMILTLMLIMLLFIISSMIMKLFIMWAGLLVIVIYLGGMMVMISYITTLTYNTMMIKFDTNKLIKLSPLIFILLMPMPSTIQFPSLTSLMYLSNPPWIPMLVLIMVTILIAVLTITKLCKIYQGPMKSLI